MDDFVPTVTVRVTLDGGRPFVGLDARVPYDIEDEELGRVCGLVRRLREEFQPDYRAVQAGYGKGWAWTPPVVARIPVGQLSKLLGDDAAGVSFPIQKLFHEGEDDEYDTRGKTCGEVFEEERGLADWTVETFLAREDELDHVDKLGLAALMALAVPQSGGGNEGEDF